MAIFGLFLNTIIVNALICALVISLLIFHFSNKLISSATTNKKQQEMQFFSYLASAWDNIFLNNQSIVSRYVDRLKREKHKYKSKTLVSVLTTDTAIFGLQNLSWLPLLVGNFWLIYSGSASQTEILALMLLIPKQIELMEGISSFNQMLTFWHQDKINFQQTLSMTEVPDSDLLARINFEKIFINGKKYKNINELLELISSTKHGRIEIRGDNGSGKSSLLIACHAALSGAFYLPAKPNLFIDGNELLPCSTGQSMGDHLMFLSTASENILLLDE